MPKSLSKYKKALNFYQDSPELDYFIYADSCDKDSQVVDLGYLATLEKIIKLGSQSARRNARVAKSEFKDRYVDNSYFKHIYDMYWNNRNRAYLSSNLQQQSREATINMARQTWQLINRETQAAFNTMGTPDTTLGTPVTTLGTPVTTLDTPAATQGTPATTVNTSATTLDTPATTLGTPATILGLNNFYEDKNDLFDFVLDNISNIIDLSNPEEVLLLKCNISAKDYEDIIECSLLPTSNLSSECKALIERLSVCPTSIIQLRYELMNTKEFTTVLFDPYQHNDWDIVHNLTSHFLRMLESPVNPISVKSLERTHATWSTYPFINSLFLQYTNIIKIRWCEVLHSDTGDTKLDGLGVGVHDDEQVFVLELAGGYVFNDSREEKYNSDSKKVYQNVINTLSLRNNFDKIFTVIYHNNILYLESLVKFNRNYVRKRYGSIKYPVDIIGLKLFIKDDLPVALLWKNAVIKHRLQKLGSSSY